MPSYRCDLLARFPDYPSTATFLTAAERDHLVGILRRDTAGEPSHFEIRFLWETLGNPKLWLLTVIYIGITVPIYSFTFFLPTIIHALGFSATNAQLLSTVPNAVACGFMLLLGTLSDRARTHGPSFVALSLLGIVGDGDFSGNSTDARVECGQRGSLMKAVIFVLIGMVGNLDGICASFVYRTGDAFLARS
ncbi:major facilitator superfamily domain-containing protein [Mycena capillaripes]|nr:major facilitator superfamily domain-containing protein [Mycena capillaripes]